MKDSNKIKSVITCDMEGRVETFNKGAEQIFGYSSDEVIGKMRVSNFSPGNVVLSHVATWLKTASKEGEYKSETTFVHKDGSLIPANIKITPNFKTIDGNKIQVGYCGQTTIINNKSPEETMPPNPWWFKLLSGLVITRLPFLSATWIPVILASVWSYNGGINSPSPFDWLLFSIVFAGASFLHLSANTFNDYFDWKSGADKLNNDYFLQYSGGSRAIELGLISESGLFRLGSIFTFLAVLCGLIIMLISPDKIIGLLIYGLIGSAGGLFYTAPPFRFSSRKGLGELSIGLLFGPIMTMGVVYALTGIHSLEAFYIGIPLGLLTTAILWVNQFPDTPSDIASGKIHLVATLGIKNARWGYLALIVSSFLTIYFLFSNGVLPSGSLIMLYSIPLGIYLTKKVFDDFEKRELATTCANTIYFHMLAGILLIIGISFF